MNQHEANRRIIDAATAKIEADPEAAAFFASIPVSSDWSQRNPLYQGYSDYALRGMASAAGRVGKEVRAEIAYRATL